jgi:hypothetical protein
MDPAWSGKGGALVPTAELCRSCVPPAHQLLYLNCNCYSQFTYHHVITQITVSHFVFFALSWKIAPPLHPFWPGLGGCAPPPPPVNPSLMSLMNNYDRYTKYSNLSFQQLLHASHTHGWAYVCYCTASAYETETERVTKIAFYLGKTDDRCVYTVLTCRCTKQSIL